MLKTTRENRKTNKIEKEKTGNSVFQKFILIVLMSKYNKLTLITIFVLKDDFFSQSLRF